MVTGKSVFDRAEGIEMIDREELRTRILERLTEVIDPETGVDVIRMRLIEDLVVDQDGYVKYKFRPSSPLCPIAVPLSVMIQEAVASVPGVSGQDLEITGYIQAEELTASLRELLNSMGYSEKTTGEREE
jgi:metal-sulfur cluster biosynthetic enzyme